MEPNLNLNPAPTSPLLIQQNTFLFESDGLTFDSQFDSGNLLNVERKSEQNFDLFVASDCQHINNLKSESYKVWFYFKITSSKSLSLKLSIKNLSSFLKDIFLKGHLPVFHIDGDNEADEYDQKWSRLDKKDNNFNFFEDSLGLNLSFTFAFKTYETVYFAYSYPFSYSDNLTYIKTLKLMLKNNKNIYFNVETLTNSLEQRKIHYITLTSNKNQSPFKEKTIHKYLFTKNPNKRPNIFPNKKYIVISSRVHPGETPASFMLQGTIEYIIKTPNFLDNFVVVILPMLNPDGVFRGYYRLDVNGKNLNRVYHSSYYLKYPAIFALKRVVNYLNEEKRLYAYFDYHAHNLIDKSFLFGNKGKSSEEHIEIKLIPQIMSLISKRFEIGNCKFESKGIFLDLNEGNKEKFVEEIKAEKNANISADKNDINDDKIGKNDEEKKKEEVFPVAKTHFFKDFGVKLSYTFESSYNGGYLTDILANDKDNKKTNNFFFFDRNSFKEIGKQLMMSVMEYSGLNEKSIIEPYGYRSVQELRVFLQKKNGV